MWRADAYVKHKPKGYSGLREIKGGWIPMTGCDKMDKAMLTW
jgi:hypothetical protein